MHSLMTSRLSWTARVRLWWLLRAGQLVRGLDAGELGAWVHATLADDAGGPALTEVELALQQQDPWYFSHLVAAPRIITQALGGACAPSHHLLDFGCGDGLMSLGVCRRSGAMVEGCDLTDAFEGLPQRMAQVPKTGAWPDGLSFRRTVLGKPLPFDDASFDGGFSWSVFEHVADIGQVLAELRRVLKPGAPLFVQIEPLYYSPYGSHLRRLVDEPWAHLRYEPAAFRRLAQNAQDATRPAEQDVLYRENSFEDVKTYLLTEYDSLNRVRTVELVQAASQAGFTIARCTLKQVSPRKLDPSLLRQHSAHDLRTREIRLLLTNPEG